MAIGRRCCSFPGNKILFLLLSFFLQKRSGSSASADRRDDFQQGLRDVARRQLILHLLGWVSAIVPTLCSLVFESLYLESDGLYEPLSISFDWGTELLSHSPTERCFPCLLACRVQVDTPAICAVLHHDSISVLGNVNLQLAVVGRHVNTLDRLIIQLLLEYLQETTAHNRNALNSWAWSTRFAVCGNACEPARHEHIAKIVTRACR
mmetsp:Transcript_49518/g.117874  ORF Transcript_49518/g.117874 Transcript_49518/m.117874 type:complete len:207 (-) Transcript_49518:1775-2395(-)